MSIEPIVDRVLVRVERTRIDNGFALPDSVANNPCDGVVDSVGPDVRHLSRGDFVFIPKKGGYPIKSEDGSEYVLIRESDCLGIKI